MDPFKNTRYEYTAIEYPNVREPSIPRRVELEIGGWKCVFTDLTSSGVFAVYRRSRPRLKKCVPERKLRKTFFYGQKVRVKEPGRRAFVGTVYSEYRICGPGRERRICVNHPDGGGVGYLVRYVSPVKGA